MLLAFLIRYPAFAPIKVLSEPSSKLFPAPLPNMTLFVPEAIDIKASSPIRILPLSSTKSLFVQPVICCLDRLSAPTFAFNSKSARPAFSFSFSVTSLFSSLLSFSWVRIEAILWQVFPPVAVSRLTFSISTCTISFLIVFYLENISNSFIRTFSPLAFFTLVKDIFPLIAKSERSIFSSAVLCVPSMKNWLFVA